MKKTVLFLITLFFISFFAYAQQSTTKSPREAKIKALKIAFITEELSLTSNEAEKFWPVYNKFDELLYQLETVEKFKIKTKIKRIGGIENISEKDAKSMMKKIADLEKQVYKTKIAFDIELTEVLSFKKILKLKIVERDFIRNLMKKYRRMKSNPKN